MTKRLSEAPTVHPQAEVGPGVTLGRWTEVGRMTSLSHCELGDYSYICDFGHVIWTSVGKWTNIANMVRLNPGNHPMDRATQHHAVYRASMYGFGADEDAFFDWRRAHWVTVGHDVWIGHGATVTAGVRIGTGAVVGAGAVVTRDVAPYTVVAGAPARPIRRRFTEAQEAALMDIAWWDWDHDRFGAAIPDFRALPIDAFIEKYRP
ncbi:DapH/DapD/GlmU-related protein [Roseicyclus persicicus]|uniref:Chloramphenicol acetyltransferase n=1 Tax=Roseicyclus persicicus TaxID=2650661 RepID=A0A7X6JXH2_9RHOB|nr:DapH/DapD/GlmU-related protein [Roseibacterium persicicum]NKX44790.1 chloramphenicol acetyltransferase [Roseibacterium persicicum]